MSESKWMTSFYYEQDLRSYYMNGILNASLRPGIYGANMCVFASDEEGTEGGNKRGVCKGINLFIKKGTTFIFSNNYKKGSGNTGTERDLNNLGNFLIKSIALEDIIVPLADIESENSQNTYTLLGRVGGTSEATRVYVVATLKYDPNSTSNMNPGSEGPSFYCFFNNPSFDSDNLSISASRYFSYEGVDGGSQNSTYLPDSAKDMDTAGSDLMLSYLMCGVIVSSESEKSYLNAAGTAWGDSGSSGWNNNHSFIGRGLSDYRHNLSSDSLGETSDVLIDTGSPLSENNTKSLTEKVSCGRVLLDLKDSLLNGRIINSEKDLSNLYCWGPYSYDASEGIAIRTYTEEELKKRGAGDYAICDLIYLSACFKKAEIREDLSGLIQNNKSGSVILEDYSWICNVNQIDSFKGGNNSTTISNFISNTYTRGTELDSYTSAALGDNIVPLDISEVNQSRLISLIRNKDILGPVINNIRLENSEASRDTIVPVALIFRAFKVDSSGNIEYLDSFTSKETFNPINLLSFFDLQYKSHKINVLNANMDNVYNVLAVVE